MSKAPMSPSMRSIRCDVSQVTPCPYAICYEEGRAFLLDISPGDFVVKKKAPLPLNATQDFQVRQSMDGHWFVSSEALGQSQWAPWLKMFCDKHVHHV